MNKKLDLLHKPIFLVPSFRSLLKIFVYLLLTCNNSSVSAKEKSILTAEGVYSTTYDEIRQYDWDLNYRDHRRDLGNPYENEANSALDFGLNLHLLTGTAPNVDYSAIRLMSLLAYKSSPENILEGTWGFHYMEETKNSKNDLIFVGALKDEFSVSDGVFGQFGFARDLTVLTLRPPRPSTDFLVYHSLYGHLGYYLKPNLRVKGKFDFTYFSDGNFKNEQDFEVMYGLSLDRPWFWLGLGANKLSFNHTEVNYWSPTNYYSFGPRLDANVPLFGVVSFFAGGSLNAQYDGDNAIWGYGYYLNCGLAFFDRNKSNFKLSYTRIYSESSLSRWYSNQFGLQANFMF